jgi:hypothetical protein
VKEEYRAYFADHLTKAVEEDRVALLTEEEKADELKVAVERAAKLATEEGGLVAEGLVCPDNEVRFVDSTQMVVQSNVFKESDHEALRKVCSPYRKFLFTVFVHLRGDRSEIELYGLSNLMKTCANEEHFTAILLLPMGSVGDSMKKKVEKVMGTMGKVSNLYISNVDPLALRHFASGGFPTEFQQAPMQCIRHAVVVHFSVSNEPPSVTKGSFELLAYPNIPANMQYSYTGDPESNNSYAVKDTDQLSPMLLEQIWYSCK